LEIRCVGPKDEEEEEGKRCNVHKGMEGRKWASCKWGKAIKGSGKSRHRGVYEKRRVKRTAKECKEKKLAG